MIKLGVGLSLLMTVLLLGALILVRSRNAIYRRRQIMLTTRWRDLFARAEAGESLPESLPEIQKQDWLRSLRSTSNSKMSAPAMTSQYAWVSPTTLFLS